MAKGKKDRRKKQKETSDGVQQEPKDANVQPTASTSGSQAGAAASAVTTATATNVQSQKKAEHEVQPVATTSKISAIVTPGAEGKALVQQMKELSIEPSKTASDPKMPDKKKVETEIVESFKPESKVDLPFVKRPGYGKLGHKVQLIVNYYRLKVRRLTIYHYDVVVEQLTKNIEAGAGDASKLLKSRQISARNINHLVVKQMCDTYSGVKEVFHGKLPVFDGQKSLYSAKELLLPKEGRFLVKHNEGGRESEFAVTLKYAGHVEYNPDRHVDASDKMTQVLEIMLAYGPRFAKHNPKLVIRSSLYDTKAEAVDLGENKQLRFGCYGNVKHTKEGLMFNLDRKAAVFHRGGMLLSVIQQIGVTFRPPYKLSKRERDLIDGQLKHLKIAVIHMNYERKYTYQKLTEKPASEITFMHDGKKVSVKNYFEEAYKDSLRRLKITLNGNFPCVNVGREKYLPLEVCKLLPDQQFSGKLPEHILGQMTRQSSQMKPAERFAKINQYRNELAADGRDYMAQMGVELDVQMVTVDGRVLPMPKLVNKDANRQSATAFIPQKMGSWKMDGPAKHFFHTVPCAKWLMFNFAHPNITRDSVDQEQCKSFVMDFRRIAAKLGMQFAMPAEVPPLLNPQDFAGHIGERLFTKALGKYPDLRLIVFIIPDVKGLYEEIKLAGDVTHGVPTQCVKCSHFTRQKRRGQLLPPLAFNEDYLGNLLQKVNSRLGGINVILEPSAKPDYLKKATMVVGIDASHPSPNDRVSRSVAACVASFDVHHSKFLSSIMVQEPFKKVQHANEEKEKLVEEIVKLDQMMISILTKYQEVNKKLPENIIIFRDGVSDGQFKTVFTHEIQALQNSFTTFGAYKPKLTLIIVQKRHHTRFMPKQAETRSGNVLPGTCVDDLITSPVLWDYYLCSHDGALGTSRPARYSVLWDEYGFNADTLQLITFHCCFLYGRCLKPVSIPAPVYYAHLASKRARDHLKVISESHDRPTLGDMQKAVDTQKSIAKNVTYFV